MITCTALCRALQELQKKIEENKTRETSFFLCMKKYLKLILTNLLDKIPKKSLLNKLIMTYQNDTDYNRKRLLAIVVLVLVGLLLILGYILGFGHILHGLFGAIAPITYVVYLIILFLILRVLIITESKGDGSDDFTGRVTENGAFGSSRWLTSEDAAEVFDISPISETKHLIFGQLEDTRPGSHVVCYKPEADGAVQEYNTLVFGNPGSGKSVTIVMPTLFQCGKMGHSIAVADSKGDVRLNSINQFRKPVEEGGFGYNTYTFSTKNPEYSQGWNMLKEVINPETDRLDSTRLNLWVDIYFANTAGAGEQKYFRDGSDNLMKVLIAIITWRRETYIQDLLGSLYQKVTGKTFDVMELKRISLKKLRNIILDEASLRECNLIKVQNEIDHIYVTAPKVNIDILCALDTKFELVQDEIATFPPDHPGKIAWDIIMKVKEKNQNAWSGYESGLSNRLKLFTDRKLRLMLSIDDINLHDITKEKSIIYIIFKDGDSTYAPILSMFFTFLVLDSKEEFDYQFDFDDKKNNNRLPLQLILDEMYSIGTIGGWQTDGTASWLPQQLSSVRSRLINMTMIFQGYTQLVELYGESQSNTIITCCSNMIFLGGKDPKSLDFFSNYAGATSAINESHSETNTIVGKKTSDEKNVSSVRALLITADELRRLPKRKLILIHDREHPIRLSTFYYKDDPITRNISKAYVKKDIKSIEDRITDGELSESAYYLSPEKTSDQELIKRNVYMEIINSDFASKQNTVEAAQSSELMTDDSIESQENEILDMSELIPDMEAEENIDILTAVDALKKTTPGRESQTFDFRDPESKPVAVKKRKKPATRKKEEKSSLDD